MTESELRFVLCVVTATRRVQVPLAMRSEELSTESFRRETARIAERSRSWVLGEGIQGLGLGEKISGGRGTGSLALRVYVETKKPEGAVESPVPGRVTVPGVGQCSTDVIEIGRIHREMFTERVRPAMPGSGLGHPDCGVGTFGCLVRERGAARGSPEGGPFVLSNAHVLADDGCALPGDDIVQPGGTDGGTVPTDRIAEYTRSVPFDFDPASFDNLMDAAIARVLDPNKVRHEVRLLGHPIRGVARVLRRGMEVVKVGRTTDLTIGIVQDVDFRFHLDYKRPGHRSVHYGRSGHTDQGRVGFRDQVLCTRYTAAGDSGAAVLNRQGYLLGLHFAGSASASVFSPIRPVFRTLGIELDRT